MRIRAESYQLASELAYYGGLRRFGPTPGRPSQLDLWAAPKEPGQLEFSARAEPAGRDGEGAGPGSTVVEVSYRRERVRALRLEPLEPAAGEERPSWAPQIR